MRIVNLQQFLELPPGTLFAKYRTCYADEISVLHEAMTEYQYPDFVYADLTGIGVVDNTGSNDMMDKLFAAEKEPISLKSDFEITARDGLYEPKQLFLIYEEDDINGMIVRLKKCLTAIPQVKEKLCQFQGADSSGG